MLDGHAVATNVRTLRLYSLASLAHHPPSLKPCCVMLSPKSTNCGRSIVPPDLDTVVTGFARLTGRSCSV